MNVEGQNHLSTYPSNKIKRGREEKLYKIYLENIMTKAKYWEEGGNSNVEYKETSEHTWNWKKNIDTYEEKVANLK